MNVDKAVDKILEAFSKYGVERKDVESRLKLLIDEFKIPVDEAVKTVVNWIKKNYQISEPVILAEPKKIAELNECDEGQFVTVKCKVVQLWDPKSPSIKQAGLVGDETGVTKFVVWAKAENVPMLEEGKCYVLKNVAVNFYQNRAQVQVNTYSTVEEIDEDIQLPARTVEFVAPMVHIMGNSGLIQRCPECHRVVSRGVCTIHGKVKPYDDLRVKAVFDDGENVYNVLLNEDAIKDLTGIDLEKAKEMAKETMSREVVLEELQDKLIGRYYHVRGRIIGDWILAEEITFAKFYPSQIPSEVM